MRIQRIVANALAEIFVLAIAVWFLITCFVSVKWWECFIVGGILVVFHVWLWKRK